MTTELPHHVSSEKEIENLLKEFKNLLEYLPRPNLITIARCALTFFFQFKMTMVSR